MNNITAEGKIILKGRFVLEEILGHGGMGTVYKALDLLAVEARDKEPYLAIKLLNSELLGDPRFFIAMQREAKKAKSLAHPNIIAIYDFDRDGSNVYLSMQLLKGSPLSAFIKQHSSGIALDKALPIVKDMASALAHAHKNGIVHSDFKPGNVFVDDQGHVTVLDFGIACQFERTARGNDETTVFDSRSLNALSPPYASLEMLNNVEPDPRDDIYALACVTYELLSGKHPFSRSNAQQAYDLKAQPSQITSISNKQWKGLLHGLQLKREHRTKTVDKFIAEISPSQSSKAKLYFVASITFASCVVLASYWSFQKSQEQSIDSSAQINANINEPKKTEMTSIPAEAPTSYRDNQKADSISKNPINLQLSASSYNIGDPMIIFVETEKPMYITLIHTNSKGEVSTIYPNSYETYQIISAGDRVRIPRENADYEFTVSGPSGIDRIEALGSSEPLPITENIIDGSGKINAKINSLLISRTAVTVKVY
ncbi:serine/threonine-protein kinase [Methylomonas sp. MO1]|uniref:serine/threonine-protein kinase n=1 Tax=unclassified Methylomonas TaxID=2608980 RepID=UPI00047B7268|nr:MULTISPECIES: serine/threonine-protein kinase [unclassified Methylomonas]MDT4291939.1 serine/threonine-protein kinase [Methylomonas sp. MO1]